MAKQENISFTVYSNSKSIIREVEKGIKNYPDSSIALKPQFFQDLNKALDYLNYGQINSRFFFIEYWEEDPIILETISSIHKDPWLHGTVMIILARYLSSNSINELIQLGVVDCILENEIQYKLPTIIKIISSNYSIFESQIFLPDHYTSKKGTMLIKNKISSVPKATNVLMGFCYAAGFRNIDTYNKISICLHEMLTNAIEHGNCGIGYNHKTEILLSGENIKDVIDRISLLPENKDKTVKVAYHITSEKAIFTITDEGEGFDPNNLPNPQHEDNITLAHGRGIMVSRSFVHTMDYSQKGNSVRLVFLNTKETPKSHDEILQLSTGEIIQLKTGDTLFETGSESDFFYYILSGRLGIYVNGKNVATATHEDVFIGEMGFLHHNKRTATVIALSNSSLMPISRNGFIYMIKKYPYSGVFLARLLTKRLLKHYHAL